MKIDYETLRRCNNCRFEAKNADEPVYGDIHVLNSGEIAFFYSPEDVATEQRLFPSHNGHRYIEYAGREKFEFFFSLKFSDFKIIPRNPETYQDWHAGDELTDKSHNGVYTVVFRCGEVVLYKYRVGDSRYLRASRPYTCEELFDKGYRLVLTDVEKQIIEEKPAEGMQALVAKELDGYTPRGRIEGFPMEVIAKILERQYEQTGKVDVKVFEKFRSNSKEDGGFRWECTPEGFDFWKEVLALEDFSAFFRLYPREDKRQFRKFDPVLVRDVDGSYWIPAVFKQMCPLSPRPFQTIDGTGWKQCVPLNEETVGCLGTTQKIPNQCGKE